MRHSKPSSRRAARPKRADPLRNVTDPLCRRWLQRLLASRERAGSARPAPREKGATA